MKCKKCNIQKDPKSDMMICLTCGTVYEESQIVVDALEFDDNQQAAGTFIDQNKQSYIYRGGRNTLSMIDPTQRNLKEVHKKMESTANILTIEKNIVDIAKKLYTIASNKKFTQGRKTNLIVGAILYLACRWKKTKHLLIDFSEVLGINLFAIGTLYIKLVKLLDLKIEIIDPSLYLCRFINKFKLGKRAKEVEDTAKKILQFMERDWITYGRRPAGLCGACILISAKLHKLSIDINVISKVVHVCPQTIINRIDEFSLTRVATMTVEEFASFKKSHFYPGADPPAFLKAIKKNVKKDKNKEEEKNQEEEMNIEEIHNEEKKKENGQTIMDNGNVNCNNKNDSLILRPTNSGLIKKSNDNDILTFRPVNSGLNKNNNYNIDSFTFKPENSDFNRSNNYNSDLLYFKPNNSGISNNNLDLSLKENNSGISKNNINLSLRPNNSGISKNNINLSLRPNNSGTNKSIRFNESKALSLAEEKLSNIPDNEDYKYIYSKDEYGLRKEFWEIMFKDWIEQQKEKEEKEGKEKKKEKEPRKRGKKNIFKSDGNQRTPFEAIKSSNIFGKKINHSYIKSMMSKRK